MVFSTPKLLPDTLHLPIHSTSTSYSLSLSLMYVSFSQPSPPKSYLKKQLKTMRFIFVDHSSSA